MSRFPVGERIRRIGGVLEREEREPPIENYSAIIEFEDGIIGYLAQNAVAPLDYMPDDMQDIPMQVIDGKADFTGCIVSNAFRLHRAGERSYGFSGPQLFIVLDQERLMGVVPTQKGTLLHVETLLTCPLFRLDDQLVTLDNKPTSLDELAGM